MPEKASDENTLRPLGADPLANAQEPLQLGLADAVGFGCGRVDGALETLSRAEGRATMRRDGDCFAGANVTNMPRRLHARVERAKVGQLHAVAGGKLVGNRRGNLTQRLAVVFLAALVPGGKRPD